MIADVLLAIFCVPILTMIAFTDLKEFRIPNVMLLALIAVFAVYAILALPWAEIGLRLALSLGVFAICFTLFLVANFSPGDAKAATVCTLLIEPRAIPEFLMGLALSGLAALLIIAVMRRFITVGETGVGGWQVWTRPRHVPYGFPLAGVTMIFLILRAVSHHL